jgi:hypothetical protein
MKMENLAKLASDYSVAKYYKEVTTEKIICHDVEHHKSYYWNAETMMQRLE